MTPHELAETHVPYMHGCVQRFIQSHHLPAHFDFDELTGSAQMALVSAARSYDQKRGLKFTTHAWSRMWGAMTDELRRADVNTRGVRRAIQTGGPMPRIPGTERRQEPVTLNSLNAPAPAEGSTLLDTLASTDDTASTVAARLDTLRALRTLKPREIEVVIRTAAGDDLNTLARDLGITQSRVSQIGSRSRARFAAEMAA